jgi:putative ABC transport system permease protein
MAEKHDLQSQERLIHDLRNGYQARHIEATFFQSASEVRTQNRTQFDLITYLMLSMSILAAIVGGFGLMGTMSINVVERGREVGVMRAIGAASVAVVGLFVSEGTLLGLLSWLLAVPLSYPGSLAFCSMVGSALLRTPLDFRYSAGGVALWFLIVISLSALASLWPALTAARISVREALAYE